MGAVFGFLGALEHAFDVQVFNTLICVMCASLARLHAPALGLGVGAGIYPQEMLRTSPLAYCNAAARAIVCVECRLVTDTNRVCWNFRSDPRGLEYFPAIEWEQVLHILIS